MKQARQEKDASPRSRMMRRTRDRGEGSRGRLATAAILIVAAAGLFATPAPARAEVKWQITMTHANAFGRVGGRDPYARSGKTFARESTYDTYTITVKNSGTEASQPEPVVVSDQLPRGLTMMKEGASGDGWECHTKTESFECTRNVLEETRGPGEAYPPITAAVSVSPSAEPPATEVATLKNEPEVSGGGAAGATILSGTESEATITPAVPFGIDSFATHVGEFKLEPGEELEFTENAGIEALEKTFTPFQQAGGHPPSLTTDFLFDYTFAQEGPPVIEDEHDHFRIQPTGGNAKEVQTELPPGFVGDVVDMPKCSLAIIQKGSLCPENTAVGYAAVDLSGQNTVGLAEVKQGGHLQLYYKKSEIGNTDPATGDLIANNTPLLYNMQPAAGSVAAFGFVVLEFSYVLEVHVRTDGDYGVTVGDRGSGGDIPSIDVTTCGNGVEQVAVGKVHEGSNLVIPSCRPSTAADSEPFLTNPTKCTGAAPLWGAVASSWAEPQARSSKTVATNAQLRFAENGLGVNPTATPQADSFLEGCNNELPFKPESKFGPDASSEGGSNQADAPTGTAFELKVPQAANEANKLATPDLKKIVTNLPQGMTASPSAADGLQACTNEQFGLGTEFGTPEHPLPPGVKPTEPATEVEERCPKASQIGTAEVRSTLLDAGPVATGPAGAAHTLTCTEGHWSLGKWDRSRQQLEEEGVSFSYQWLKGGKNIEGADEEIYSLGGGKDGGVKGELPEAIQCQVTASSKSGSSVGVSQPVAPTGPLPFPPANIAEPSGTASPGNALTCAAGVWTSRPALERGSVPKLTFSYKWLRDGEVISGTESVFSEATTSSYLLTPDDAGKAIQCQVTGKTDATETKEEENKEHKVEEVVVNVGGEAIADSPAVIVAPVPASAPPLPGGALQGQLFVGQPECSPCSNEDAEKGKLLRLFLQINDPQDGLVVRQVGHSNVNAATGQIETVFDEAPQDPFEQLRLTLKGGPRAPLANPPSCGAATTTNEIEPWSAKGLRPKLGGLPGEEEEVAGTPNATVSSTFNVTFNGAGEPCPATLPFSPSFNGGTIGASASTAGASTNFSVTFGREDREQYLSGLTMHMPLGLVGRIPAVKECGEAEVEAAEHNAGECPAASEIGTATSVAGPGEDPFSTQGHVYFTGPYKGAPFGLAVVTLAKAGPFNLGNVVVRSAIRIDPNTAAVTVTSDPLPQIVGGVPIRLRKVHVEVNKPGFMLNPTNCSAQQVSATLGGAQGASAPVSSPFGITGCKNLPFKPTFTASTQAHTSKADGASLNVKITYPSGAYANIAKSVTELPTALPSRLTTLQKACVDTVFAVNPAACPEGSVIGFATAHTPVLNQPLVGPAYLVSHGGAEFPDLEIVLQGEGVMVVLDGQTDIKKGITKTTFNAVPDSPVSTFELNLPEGPHSALGANVALCSTPLTLPTILTGQNGAVIKQTTHIAVTGCPPTVTVAKSKLKGNVLVLTLKTSSKGTVKISGKGLKTTKKSLAAGTHVIRVPLTKAGRSMRAHHKKTSVKVGLTAEKQAVVAKATSVRL